jgi:hypothetical protein
MLITPEEIAKLRSEFANYPEAIAALDEVEACDHSLDDAAEVLAIQAGYSQAKMAAQSDESYLDKLIKQARNVICSKHTDDVLELFKELREFIPVPGGSLAFLAAIKVTQIGVERFCGSPESLS